MESGTHLRLLLWKAGKAIESLDRASIAETGLHTSDFAIMEALLHKGPLPISVIGQKVLLTSGSMTAAVDRLEKKGLVRRLRDPSDGRCFHVHLTEQGRRVIEKAYQEHAHNLERVAGALTAVEQAELARLLKKFGRQAERMLLP